MELIEELVRLPISERIELVELLWDSIGEDPASLTLTSSQSDELRWRLDHPSVVTYSLEEVEKRARQASR